MTCYGVGMDEVCALMPRARPPCRVACRPWLLGRSGAIRHVDLRFTIAGGDGSRQPSENQLEAARFQGRLVAEVAKKLHGCTLLRERTSVRNE